MNNSKLMITILLLALVQMGAIFMSPIIGELIEAFPQYSSSTCQMLMTFPNLVVVLMSIITGKLDPYVSRRNLAAFACLSYLVGALGLFLFHTNLMIMFVFSGLVGVGVGILLSLTATLVSLYFTPDQQASLYGRQNAFTSLGGVILNLIGGVLAGIAWYYDFLSALIIIPGFIMVLKYVPNEKGVKQEKTKTKAKIPTNVYFYCLLTFLFAICFNTLPTNISIFISENGLGGSSVSGVITAIVLLGGATSGMFFDKLSNLFGEKVAAVGFLNLGIGLMVISFASNLPLLIIGAFIGGCSISLLMAQLTLSISGKTNPLVTPMAMSLFMAFNNLGNFISPTVFSLVPGNDVASGYFIVAIAAMVMAVLFSFKLDKKQV